MEKCAQPVLQLAVLVCVAHTWKSGNYFYEAHVTGSMCDDDGSGACAGTGPCKFVSVTHCSVVVLCGYTHCTP